MLSDIWLGAILGAVLGSIVIPGVHFLLRRVAKAWRESRPTKKLLGSVADNAQPCRIFVRDFVIEKDTKLYSIEPRIGVGIVPNVLHLWPDVEGQAAAKVLNVLGQAGKTQNLDIVRMSQDTGVWDCNVIVLGAQASKAESFFKHLKKVAFRVDSQDIYEAASNTIVPSQDGYGYGLILKAENPHRTGSTSGVGFLIGGFGTLGTLAAAHYFQLHYRELGETFGSNCFGIVVRAPIAAGEQAVERLKEWDRTVAA